MNKIFFNKFFTFAQILLMVSSTALLLSGVLYLIIAHFENSIVAPAHFVLEIEASVKGFYQWLGVAGLVTLSLFLVLLSIEVIIRLRHDNLANLWQSICLTLRFRRFLRQDDRSETSPDKQKTQSVNPTHKTFNKAARKCVIHTSDNQATACFRVPKSQQAQKILKGMEGQIKEELSTHAPRYYFSAPERIKNNLWFIGTKRD